MARRPVVVATVTALVVVVVAVVLLVAVRGGPTGAQVGVEDDTFAGCVDLAVAPDDPAAGVLDLAGAADWDDEREVAFWSEPVALDCAVGRLSAEQRRAALARAFPDPDEGGPTDREQQQAVLVGYADWLVAEEVAPEVAVLRLAAVVRGLWAADAEDSLVTEGYAEIAVLAHLDASGDLPGYRTWLRDHPDNEPGPQALRGYLNDDLMLDRADNEAPYRAYRDRTDAVVDAVR